MESHDLYKTSYLSSDFTRNTRIDDGIIHDSFFDDFSGDEFALPYSDLPELEWISNLGHESFLNDDLQNLHLIPQPHTSSSQSQSQSTEEFQVPNRTYSPVYVGDKSIPSKARSKRSRAAPCDWSSRIVPLPSEKTVPQTTPSKHKEDPEKPVRRCTHCGSEKTPQWRSGPMGPKSLCNACGVRHKSGRLVPEYRPAASPTFVSAKHSNSHRKVMELRRQKELRQFSQSCVFSESSGGDYYIHPQTHTQDFDHI